MTEGLPQAGATTRAIMLPHDTFRTSAAALMMSVRGGKADPMAGGRATHKYAPRALQLDGPTSENDPGCVKTRMRGQAAELFSLFSSFDGACQSGSFLIQRNRDKRSTRKLGVGVFTQPGSKADLTALKCDFRCTPKSRHRLPERPFPKSADTVEKVF